MCCETQAGHDRDNAQPEAGAARTSATELSHMLLSVNTLRQKETVREQSYHRLPQHGEHHICRHHQALSLLTHVCTETWSQVSPTDTQATHTRVRQTSYTLLPLVHGANFMITQNIEQQPDPKYEASPIHKTKAEVLSPACPNTPYPQEIRMPGPLNPHTVQVPRHHALMNAQAPRKERKKRRTRGLAHRGP